jgi:hypothetical protein
MKNTKTRKLCQSCERSEQMWNLSSAYKDEPVYAVCANCLLFLTTHSLRPEMYKNLLKNGHKATEFLLHDDFYDDEGNAMQPILR